MVTPKVTTETEKVMTREEISIKYYDLNLDLCKRHINENITDSKKIEMALIVSRVEDVFRNYISSIENISNSEKLNSLYELKSIFKLDLIEKIIKF
jgi:hypothetical protein